MIFNLLSGILIEKRSF